MLWDSSDHVDNRVVAYTRWRYLENYGTFEHRAGVYLFASADLHIKYVGKVGAVRMVVEIEEAIRRGKAYGARRVKAPLNLKLFVAYNLLFFQLLMEFVNCFVDVFCHSYTCTNQFSS